MNSQPLELVPNGNVFLEVGLKLFVLLLFEDEPGLGNHYCINFVVFFQSQQQLQNDARGQNLEQLLEDKGIPLLPTYFYDITFAVGGQISHYLHSYFRQIEELIARLLISSNGYFEQFLFYLHKLPFGIGNT